MDDVELAAKLRAAGYRVIDQGGMELLVGPEGRRDAMVPDLLDRAGHLPPQSPEEAAHEDEVDRLITLGESMLGSEVGRQALGHALAMLDVGDPLRDYVERLIAAECAA